MIKQLTEDSFASAIRRLPDLTSFQQIQKIYEEINELKDAYIVDAHIGHYVSIHCRKLTAVEEELADVILSCLVFAKCENIDIEKALKIKNEFNKTRK